MTRLLAFGIALAVGLAFLAFMPPARAITPITLSAWGGASVGQTCNGLTAVNQTVYVNLTSSVPSGSFVVLFIQGGWQTTALNFTPGDDGGTAYGLSVANYAQMPDTGGAFCVGYDMASYVFTGRTSNTMRSILVHTVNQGGNVQLFQVQYAAVYLNATGIGASTFIKALQNQGSVRYMPTTLTQDNSAIAFLSTEVMDTLGDGCPQTGFTTTPQLGNVQQYSFITFNTTSGQGLPNPVGYVDSCLSNHHLGFRGVDAGGALPLRSGSTYTMTFTMYAAPSGNNIQLQSVELLSPLVLPFGIGNLVVLFLFFAMLSTAVILAWNFHTWRRAHGH